MEFLMTKTIVMEFFVDVVFHLGVNIYSSRQHDSIVIATTMTYKAGY